MEHALPFCRVNPVAQDTAPTGTSFSRGVACLHLGFNGFSVKGFKGLRI